MMATPSMLVWKSLIRSRNTPDIIPTSLSITSDELNWIQTGKLPSGLKKIHRVCFSEIAFRLCRKILTNSFQTTLKLQISGTKFLLCFNYRGTESTVNDVFFKSPGCLGQNLKLPDLLLDSQPGDFKISTCFRATTYAQGCAQASASQSFGASDSGIFPHRT